MSTDPALGDYVPEAGKGNTNDSANLPGMGGVYNVVNFNLYHYGANNPVKYVDPDGNYSKVVETKTENVDYNFFSTLVDVLDDDKSFYGKTKDAQSTASLILTAVSFIAFPEESTVANIVSGLSTGDSLLSIAYAASESGSAESFVEQSLRQIKTIFDNDVPKENVNVSITTERTAIVNKRQNAAFGFGTDVYYQDKSTITIKAGNKIFDPIVLRQKQTYATFVNQPDFIVANHLDDYIPKINITEDILK